MDVRFPTIAVDSSGLVHAAFAQDVETATPSIAHVVVELLDRTAN